MPCAKWKKSVFVAGLKRITCLENNGIEAIFHFKFDWSVRDADYCFVREGQLNSQIESIRLFLWD